MTALSAPDFSAFAALYARSRPRYPRALYEWLASQVGRRELAWDCGTGNGQAAIDLAEDFAHVVATDVSAEQLRHALDHPRVSYRHAAVESSGLADASVDLVTAAASVHWFDPASFAAEVRRVARSGGLLAAWTYHPGRVAAPFDELFGRLWMQLRPWFTPHTRHVEVDYASLELPGTPIPAPRFELVVDWSLPELLGFIASWSGAQAYERERGEPASAPIAAELGRWWGEPGGRQSLRWPLVVRALRL